MTLWFSGNQCGPGYVKKSNLLRKRVIHCYFSLDLIKIFFFLNCSPMNNPVLDVFDYNFPKLALPKNGTEKSSKWLWTLGSARSPVQRTFLVHMTGAYRLNMVQF